MIKRRMVGSVATYVDDDDNRVCKYGHPWVEGNLKKLRARSGNITNRCLICCRSQHAQWQREMANNERELGENYGANVHHQMTYIHLACGHVTLFGNPLPRPKEDMWCTRCNQATIALGFGDVLNKKTGKVKEMKRRWKDGLSQHSFTA